MSNPDFCARLRHASVVCGAAGALLGLTTLVGWGMGNELLKGSFVAGITMKTNAALCISLMGGLIALQAQEGFAARALGTPLARVVAGFVLVMGAATLAQHLLGLDLGIDELLFAEPGGAVATQSPNRMGPIASLCLTLLGAARLLAEFRTSAQRAPFQYLALAVMLITSVPLLGYLFDARALFGIGKYTGIALPTAAALLLLAIGLLLAHPDVGLMRRLVADDPGALLLRRLLPAAVAVPVFLMLGRLWGQDLGWFDPVVGRALVVVGFIVVFTVVIWRTGDVVFQQATEAALAERSLHERLERSVDALAETDRRKTEFLAILAHELRNPLAPVRNAVHVLRARSRSDSEAVRTYAVIERQIEHLARLIDDLMDISRISQDKLELRKSQVRLTDVIAAAVDASRYLVEAQAHRLSVELPPSEVQLEADSARLVQVVTNLLTNAARYTPPGGQVSLRVQIEPAGPITPASRVSPSPPSSEVVIEVSDTGVGISSDQLARVFDLFYQAGPKGGRQRQGLGIGLALVRKLVELHGGTVTASSAGPGHGSSFSVRLPASTAGRSVPASSSEQAPLLPALDSLCVLVVEDNPDSAEMLSELVQLTGARVHTALDGETALVMAAKLTPQVVLLDIGLPGISGYDVAREIRLTEWGGDALLIALTGWGSDEDRMRSQRVGINQHLAKPVNPQSLMALISEFRQMSARPRGAEASAAPEPSTPPAGSPP
jgi:signal transduction histidine kinase/ActR/RegA family two-component response regulator